MPQVHVHMHHACLYASMPGGSVSREEAQRLAVAQVSAGGGSSGGGSSGDACSADLKLPFLPAVSDQNGGGTRGGAGQPGE